jgi:hypothetical protein
MAIIVTARSICADLPQQGSVIVVVTIRGRA